MRIYRSIKDIERNPALIGCVRVLRRAWVEFELDSVLCVKDVPTLYRKNSRTILTPDELNALHRKFWNQGIASVLLIVDPRTAYVLSGLQQPLKGDDLLSDEAASPIVYQWPLIEFSQAQKDSLYEAVGNGEFYRRYQEKFKTDGSVDQYLSNNLQALCKLLTESKRLPAIAEDTAHNFICRLLFACYLVDRGIASSDKKGTRLHEALRNRTDAEAVEHLYAFFKRLKGKFNGSMFDQDLDDEKSKITAAHMGKIIAFLNGDEVDKQQPTLGFWAYDFKLIPIETISGIYENFLTSEDRDKKGAHYTPRFLAEMTLDIACESRPKDWTQLRYLDFSCGSGVFLVTLFNRLATAWELKNQKLQKEVDYYAIKAAALRDILEYQIRGMDIKLSACTLACFSLYVALLDSFDPTDIKTYIENTGNKLPRLLLKQKGHLDGQNFIPVVCEGNTLETTRFDGEKFDVIVGNPPWGGEGRGSKEPSLKFIERTEELLNETGHACLLLPSKIFLNINSDGFQEKWFSNHTLDRVVQLADFSFTLFPSAKCPCMIVRFRKGVSPEKHQIIYDTPKFDASARRQGLVLITEADRKGIPQARILHEAAEGRAHVLWKRLLWGTRRDGRLLDYLEQFPKLEVRTGGAKSRKAWQKGQGVQPDSKGNCKAPMYPWWKPSHRFIDARASCLNDGFFLFEDDSERVGNRFDRLYFSREENKEIFEAPMVLISQGFGKVVYCDFSVLFQDSLQAIHGSQDDEDLLLFLTAYLKSDLAKYYCFHTSSTLGIERDTVRFKELLKLPFPLPEDAPAQNAASIVQKVAALLRTEKRELLKLRPQCENEIEWLDLRTRRARKLQIRTDKLVFQYFGISNPERALVEDTVHIFERSATPTTPDKIDLPTLQPIQRVTDAVVIGYKGGLQVYADALVGTLNGWAEEQESEWRVRASGGVDEQSGLALVTVSIVPRGEATVFETTTLDNSIWNDLFNAFSSRQAAIRHERQIIGFQGSNFYILRPHSLIHWTRTAALNDADEFFAQYLQRRRQAR